MVVYVCVCKHIRGSDNWQHHFMYSKSVSKIGTDISNVSMDFQMG